MAEKQLLLEVVTPDRMVLSTEADVVVCPGVEGQFGVLVGRGTGRKAHSRGQDRGRRLDPGRDCPTPLYDAHEGGRPVTRHRRSTHKTKRQAWFTGLPF